MKIDCSITENYLKEKARMCMNCYDGCPLSMSNNGSNAPCYSFIKICPIVSIGVIQQWSDANPQKTYIEDLLEKFPMSNFGIIGHPSNCPSSFGYKDLSCDGSMVYTMQGPKGKNCESCWNQIMEEQNA